MEESLRATESQRAIYNETFTSLASLDQLYRDDSDAVVAQRGMHEERIAKSQAALDRINENAGRREEELFERRRQLGVAALNLYSNYPEITDDRERAFRLAMQIDSGFAMEEKDLKDAVRGLIALDDAVKNDQPILRCLNGQFEYLVIPKLDATGLDLDVTEGYSTSSGLNVTFYIPAATEVEYRSSWKQYPDIETDTREVVWIHSASGNSRSQRGQRNTVAATIASNHSVSKGIKKFGQAESDAGVRQELYIIGHDLIQKAVAGSANHEDGRKPINPGFSYKTWLAGKMIGIDFKCDLEAIKEQIVKGASEIVENSAKSYNHSAGPELGSDVANILFEAIRELGAEDELFRTFASHLANFGGGNRSVFRDPEVVRILFDRVISKTGESQ